MSNYKLKSVPRLEDGCEAHTNRTYIQTTLNNPWASGYMFLNSTPSLPPQNNRLNILIQKW